jgi:hypothetical protein
MVGENYPYLYDDRNQFEQWIEEILKGSFEEKKTDLEGISVNLSWDRVLQNWDVKKYLI